MEDESEHLLDRQGNSILPQTMRPVHWTQEARKSSISAPASQIAQNKQRTIYYISSDINFFLGMYSMQVNFLFFFENQILPSEKFIFCINKELL